MNDMGDIESIKGQAINWIMRQHDEELSETDIVDLKQWLSADERHQKIYTEMRTIWTITGLIPSMDE